MKKILIISHEFPPSIGGAGIVVEQLSKSISAKDQFEVTVVTNKVRNRNKKYNFNLIEVKTIPKIRFYFYWKKIKEINVQQFDKIIINDIGAAMVAALYFEDHLKEKCIIYLHGSEPEKIFKNDSFYDKITGFKEKYIKLLIKCKNIVAVSQYMKEKFINYSRLNCLKNKIVVIYNGISTELFYPDPIDFYERYSIDRSCKLLLSVSRIVKGKGYDCKYKIFKQLISEGYKYHWIIVGKGEYLTKFKKVIKKDRLNDYITFVGNIDRDQLRQYYSSVDVFWLLSNFKESLGLVYLESIACGTPVIGRNKAGVKEVIQNGINGFLINTDEEVLKILENGKYKELDMSRGKKSISNFDNSINVEKLVQLL